MSVTGTVEQAVITEAFTTQARRRPDSVALITADSVLTYSELDQMSEAVAAAVGPYCDQRDALIGVHVDRSVAYVASCLGILRAGGGFVPLDRSYPQTRLRYMCTDADLRCVITG